MDARRARHCCRTQITQSQQGIRVSKQICLLLTREQFDVTWHDPLAVRAIVESQLRAFPELFPVEMKAGYRFVGFLPKSARLPDIQLRQIRLRNGETYTLRPSFVLPYMTGFTNDVEFGLLLLLSVGAGTGLLYLLRWFWWRINAWSEIAAMASSFLLAASVFVLQRRGMNLPSHVTLVATVAVTTAVWMTVTFLTRPTEDQRLREFYRLARPAGPGWRRIRGLVPDAEPPDALGAAFGGWLAGIALVYGALFGTGHLLLGHRTAGVIALVIGAAGAVTLVRVLPRLRAEGPRRAGV